MFHDDDLDGDPGAPDVAAMEQIRSEFCGLDGLVSNDETGFEDLITPQEITVRFDDGIGPADWARFDVTWYQSGCYRFHHTDERGLNFRWDCHPKDGAPERHFHEPPNAASNPAVESCITVEEPVLVARAVHKLWRRAHDTESLDAINSASNPP